MRKKTAHGRRRRRRRRKKRSRNGATRPACFRGIPRCCWQTPFFGAVRLPRAPARSWSSSLTYPASPISFLYSLFLSSRRISSRNPHPRTVDSSFISLLFLDLPRSPCIRGPSISSPRVSRYPEEKKDKQQKEIERKISGAPASRQNMKLGYVKTGGGDFH